MPVVVKEDTKVNAETDTPTSKRSFDTTTALAGLYLWLLFGFLHLY